MESAAGQTGFALAAIAFAIGAIYFLLVGLKELNAAMREYMGVADRDEEYQKLVRARNNNLKAIGFFFRWSALLLAAGLSQDVFNGTIFWAYTLPIPAIFIAIWYFSEKKYVNRLKKELGLE